MSRANSNERAAQTTVTGISPPRQSGGWNHRKDKRRPLRGIPLRAEHLEPRLFLSAVSFAAQQTFGVGHSPASIAVADLGNGQQDLVTVNQSDNNVSVLLGNGDGTFKPQQTYATGTTPGSVAIADLGNGHDDLVVTNADDNTVSVLLGNGNGAFQNQQTYAVGANPESVAIADLSNGHDDVVVVNADNTVSVLLGNGDGTFQSQQTYATGGGSYGVAIADLGNGQPDLIVANFFDNTVSILLGNGNGTFKTQQTYATGNGPQFVAVADLGNGKADLIVTNDMDNTISVLLGNGNGAFQAQQTYATGNKPKSVAVADLGNGQPDLIVANNMDGTLSVLPGNGNGTFQTQETFAAGADAYAVTVADVNNDGRPDIVATDNDVSVLLNDLTNYPTTTSLSPSATSVEVGAPLTLTATLTPRQATGTVTFFDGSTQLDAPVTIVNGVAATTTSSLSVGGHEITAIYGFGAGAGTYDASMSSPVSVTVTMAAPTTTTTMLTSSTTSAANGSPVSFTATISPAQATGTVTFFDGSTQLGSPVTVANGVAMLITSSLSIGGHQITAHYSGDGTYAASISSSKTVMVTTVAATTTTTTLTSSATSAGYGSSVSFTATVSPATAPGTVTFFDGATQIGAPVTVAGGVAMLASASLATGTHSITASYSGDSNNAASNAPAISLAVAPTTVVTTSLFTDSTAWETVTVVYSSSAVLGTNIGNISVTGPNSQFAYSFAATSSVSSNNGTTLTVSYVVKPLQFLGFGQASALGLVWPPGTYQVTVPAGAIVDGNGVSSALATASFYTHPLLNVFVPTLNLGLKTNTIYTGLRLYARGDIAFVPQGLVEKGEAVAQVVLSPDGNFSNRVFKLGAESVEIERRGEVLRPFHSFATVVPTDIPAGSYNVLILISDTAGATACYESYETVQIVAGVIDLTGRFLKLPPTAVKAGKLFKVTFEITNAADSTAPADGDLTYYFGTSADGKLFDDNTPEVHHARLNLKPGHSMMVHLNIQMTSSAYLVVTLDPTGNPAFLPDVSPNLNFGTANIITVE